MGAVPAFEVSSFTAAIASFAAHLASRAHPPNTVAAYVRDVTQLGAIVAGEGVEPAGLDLGVLRSWLRALDRIGITPVSRARKVHAARAFCDHLARLGVLRSNPARELVLPRVARPLPEVLDVDEVRRMLERPKGRAAADVRDRAILEALYSSGLKVAELVALNVADVQRRGLAIGGRRPRLVPLGRPAWRAVRAYLARRPELLGAAVDVDALFVGRRGERLGVRRVQTIVAELARDLGRGDVHPGVLRHSCAAHLLDGGAELHQVRALLGHASVATTVRYELVAIEKLRAVYHRAHPLGRRR